MIRPDVRVVQPQQEEIRDAQIDSWEAEQLMRKYGYSVQQNQPPPAEQRGLTFEEMIAQEDARLRAEREKARQMANAPRPHTFDGRGGYHTETRYGSDEESGYGFQVQITSDMPLPRY